MDARVDIGADARSALSSDSDRPCAYRDRMIAARDGLRLHVRDYAPPLTVGVPVVCLPGLTRSVRDFHDLALSLAQHRTKPRRVLSLDYRGRGASERDPNWQNYNLLTEAADILAITTTLDIHRADFIGTSRGGLLTMVLGAMRPGLLHRIVLNDVGPVIDAQGIIRIKRMLSEMRDPADWSDAIAATKQFGVAMFPKLDAAGWEKMARQTYRDDDGRPRLDFDGDLVRTLEAFDLNQPPPSAWPQFTGISQIPTLAIRGALSAILTSETLAEMERRHSKLETLVIDNEGHAPLLWDHKSQSRIAAFLAAGD